MLVDQTTVSDGPRMALEPKIKCLLVDDLDENLLALSALLRRDDVELLLAHSGAEALELLLVHDVALVFLDVQMPDMDGFEVAELMRGSERTRNVPIIFVTAGMRDEHRLFRGYESGAVDFLYKPIEAHVLKSKADVFFQLHRQRQQLAQQLLERTETLRLHEMFTAVLGHDLRNPLSAMLTSAHLVQKQSDNETVRNMATRMQVSVRRMSRMIEDLMDLARARLAGGISLKPEPTDLADLLPRVQQEYQAAYPTRRIELEQQGDLKGNWDAERLAQVISNLLGNALKYGTETEPVQVRADGTRQTSVSLSLLNAGGIAAETLPHLFDPFQRGQRPPGRNEGLGLGLYIVQQIVEAHGGSVSVQSEGGRTTFTVEIPRQLPSVRH